MILRAATVISMARRLGIKARTASSGGGTRMFAKNYWEKEWTAMERRERRYLRKRQEEKQSVIQEKLSEKVPEKLEQTLNGAFQKAFALVFEKGTGVIEKTYSKEKYQQNYQVNEYAVSLGANRKTVRAFSRQAGSGRAKNLVISGVEGAGLGLLGIGLPDIPIFTGVLLKSVYETALSYGFSYETEEEQCFVLGLIETAFLRGAPLIRANGQMNGWIDGRTVLSLDKEERIRRASVSLSEAMLYMKFLQGIPIAGLVGGLADTVYLKQVTDYAELKYKRRFLRKHSEM